MYGDRYVQPIGYVEGYTVPYYEENYGTARRV